MTTIARRLQRRCELGVALLLLVLGAVVLWDASRLASDVGPHGTIGPKAVPVLVGGLLVVCGVLLGREVLCGGHDEAGAGADSDLSARSDWRTVLLLSAALLTSRTAPHPNDVFPGWLVRGRCP